MTEDCTDLKRTGPRIKIMCALKYQRVMDHRPVTRFRIAKICRTEPVADHTRVLRDLYRCGLVELQKGRPNRYKITDRGLLWLGSYPSKTDQKSTEGKEVC